MLCPLRNKLNAAQYSVLWSRPFRVFHDSVCIRLGHKASSIAKFSRYTMALKISAGCAQYSRTSFIFHVSETLAPPHFPIQYPPCSAFMCIYMRLLISVFSRSPGIRIVVSVLPFHLRRLLWFSAWLQGIQYKALGNTKLCNFRGIYKRPEIAGRSWLFSYILQINRNA